MANSELTPEQQQMINYAIGQGWYEMIPSLLNSISTGRQGRATTGLGVLGHLTELLTNPGGGNLGLARQAQSGRGGPGIDTTQKAGEYQSLLDELRTYGMGVNADASDAPYTPQAVDPNQAPAMTPANAAAAPSGVQEFFNRWPTYSPEEQEKLRGIASVPGKAAGGKVKTNKDGSTQVPHPIDSALERAGLLHKALKAQADVAHMYDGGKVAGYAGGGRVGTTLPEDVAEYTPVDNGYAQLQNIMASFKNDPAKQAAFQTRMNELGTLKSGIGSYLNAEPGITTGRYARPSRASTEALSSLNQLTGASEDNLQRILDTYRGGGDSQRALIDLLNGELANTPRWGPRYNQLADGGVTLGGQPHWIVDENGYPVARITEDGAPENVRGLRDGGVEVTPLSPNRYENYTGDEAGSPVWAAMLAQMNSSMPSEVPGAVTGQQYLFPDADIPGSQVDTAGPGTNQIPTWGGATERENIQTWKPTGNTFDELLRSVENAPGATGQQQQGNILAGALHGTNTNLDDIVKQLNAVGAGSQNLSGMSAQQFSSLDPDQQAAYTALRQRMGLGSAAQQIDFMRKTTPSGFSLGGILDALRH